MADNDLDDRKSQNEERKFFLRMYSEHLWQFLRG
jgi:hypothetical protein